MAKIELIENTCTIRKMTLESKEACLLDNCAREQACPGKNNRRDNDFICNLQELLSLYKRAAERNKE
ncbi:MAG: hypothetical protein AAB598_01340 [Patescibacteria group bacterium]